MECGDGSQLKLNYWRSRKMKERQFERFFEALPGADLMDMPKRETRGSAGYDIRAHIKNGVGFVEIDPGQKINLGTGITVYIHEELEQFLDLRIRSGLANNYQLTLQNACGVIDADFYGKEIQAMVRNEGPVGVRIYHGDRIAQGIFVQYFTTDDDSPGEKKRTGGFGHTGLK
jgi:dUTP pyrophosphatase